MIFRPIIAVYLSAFTPSLQTEKYFYFDKNNVFLLPVCITVDLKIAGICFTAFRGSAERWTGVDMSTLFFLDRSLFLKLIQKWM